MSTPGQQVERNYAMFDADAPRNGELAEACYNTLAVPRERAGGFGPAATHGSIDAPSHSEHPQRQAVHP